MKNIFLDFFNNETEKGFVRKYIINKYTVTIVGFLVWMIFFDSNSFLTISDLNQEIRHYEKKYEFYRSEHKKNTDFYKKLINNKEEKEKFARENYFMKKSNEEIFILVVDSTNVKK